MKQDSWTNSKTNTTLTVSSALGSPRAWLRRALDQANLDDTVFLPGSITPSEISVAGIWYQPHHIATTGSHRELLRRFRVPPAEHLTNKRTRSQPVRVIGLCAAVPMHEVLHWISVYKNAGADYTWWNTPVDRAARALNPMAAKRPRRQLDHAAVYRMLDSGMSVTEIAHDLDFPRENIHYVGKKWSAGLPVVQQPKPKVDAGAVLADHAAGARAIDLAVTYKTTPAYVYKLINLAKKAAA